MVWKQEEMIQKFLFYFFDFNGVSRHMSVECLGIFQVVGCNRTYEKKNRVMNQLCDTLKVIDVSIPRMRTKIFWFTQNFSYI